MSIGLRLHNLARLARNTDGARREALRARAFPLVGKLTPFVGVEHDGVRYVISTRESGGVGFHTFVFGFFDEKTINHMRAALELHTNITTLDGLTILEVGANIGTETVSLLVRHGVKRIVAVEPDAENIRFLRANLALNGVQDRVEIHQIALSDTDGMLVFECSPDNWGDHRVRIADPFGPDLRDEGERVTVEVPARRLDALADANEVDLDDIDLMWMDAQGHEAHILAGAERLAAAGIPILTEYWPYGLRRAGALDRFHALVAERYSIVVDLREPDVALDAGRVSELADRYVANEGGDPVALYTDLLLLSSSGFVRNADRPTERQAADQFPSREVGCAKIGE
jgi:FkbM family methyltransferase